MPAQGWSVAIPWGSHQTSLQTLKAFARIRSGFANAFSVRARFSFATQGTNPGLKFANSFGVQPNRELLRSSNPTRTLRVCASLLERAGGDFDGAE